jgi:hypothetical protein
MPLSQVLVASLTALAFLGCVYILFKPAQAAQVEAVKGISTGQYIVWQAATIAVVVALFFGARAIETSKSGEKREKKALELLQMRQGTTEKLVPPGQTGTRAVP